MKFLPDTLLPPPSRFMTVRQTLYLERWPRIRARIQLCEKGCWNWVGWNDGKGYGKIEIEGFGHYIHIITYTLWHGDVPEGFEVDHKCLNRSCSNPEHLRPLTRQANMARRWGREFEEILSNELSGVAK